MPVELVELKFSNSQDYHMKCSWERRKESPEDLATRFLYMIDSLTRIDPVFNLWSCGRKRTRDLEKVQEQYAQEIAEGISRDDWGAPLPYRGYYFHAQTRDTPKDHSFRVMCRGGATLSTPFPNDAMLDTNSYPEGPSPQILTYSIFRPALLAMVEAWEPVTARAYPHQLLRIRENTYFPKAWIQYLCPWLAEKITPPTTALVERLPNGGLLMTATTETFDVNNPRHMAVAEDMAAAMAPLDRLPWPSER